MTPWMAPCNSLLHAQRHTCLCPRTKPWPPVRRFNPSPPNPDTCPMRGQHHDERCPACGYPETRVIPPAVTDYDGAA